MKYLKYLFVLAILISVAQVASAASQPKFPSKIGSARLSPNEVQYEPKRCYDNNWGTTCSDYWRAQYEDSDGTYIFVTLSNVYEGMDLYKAQVTASSRYAPEYKSYVSSENHYGWFPKKKGKLSSYSFNNIVIHQAEVIYSGTNSYDYEYRYTSPLTTDVGEYFLKKFPAAEVSANPALLAAVTAPLTGASIEITSPTSFDTLVAGKTYEVKWNSANLPPDTQVLFQLEYANHATGQTTGASMNGTMVKNKEGKFKWKVSNDLAYGDKNSFDNYVYRIWATVSDVNGRTAYEAYSPIFRIVRDGSKKSEISFTEFPDFAEIQRGEEMTVKWVENPHIDRYVLSPILEKGKKSQGSIYDALPTNTFIEEYRWRPWASMKSGSYYFLIEGYINGTKVAEGKSKTFKIK